MFVLSLVNLPNATTTFAGIGAYSSPMFNEMLPLAYIAIGFSVAGFLIGFLIFFFTEKIISIFHKDKFDN